MQTTDWITAIVALYAAVISSYLGYREIQKERRRIKLILEYISFTEIVQLIIVNSGHRPVTITEIAMAISIKGTDGKEYTEGVPSNALFDPVDPGFPKLISDGQTIIFKLGPVLIGEIMERFIKGGKVYLSVYDAEGNVYTKYERREGNAKWGGSQKI